MTIPVWDELGHNSGRLFPLAYQVRKIGILNRGDYPGKGEGTPAIREMKVEQKGRELKGWKKMFSNFLVVVRREALCLAFMSCKHTYNVHGPGVRRPISA